MQTSDEDVVECITALGKVGVDQLVDYLGAHDADDEDVADKDQTDDNSGDLIK